MRYGHRIVAIIPALNEAEALPAVLERIPDWFDAVVVADNGSTDATANLARERGALVTLERQRGYGAACQAGVEAARSLLAADDLAVFFDADGSDDPGEASALVDPILAGRADLVTGRRLGRERMLLHQRLGTAWVAALLRRGFGVDVRDLGPFRA
ncbi:MAG: glycosyltransferase family 2 protein, partial [Actinomycetota bacterium]